MTRRYICRSTGPEETRAYAQALAALLEPGDVIALSGELGSGKTEFVRGLAQGLGVPEDEPVQSPTFVLAHEYHGRLRLMHLDLYRLEEAPPDLIPDLEEYLSGPWVTAVEWAERAAGLLRERLEVTIAISGEAERVLTLAPHGARWERLLAACRFPGEMSTEEA